MSLILNESLVLAKTRSQDLKSVLKLNCWGSGIKDVSLIRQLINVEVVGLSCNEITTLEDFAYCKKLKELILRGNKIKNIAEIAHLQKLPALTSLWLQENPCVEATYNYRKVVLKALPQLKVLDNKPVTREELQEIEELGDDIYEEIPYDSTSSHSSGPQSQSNNSNCNNNQRQYSQTSVESQEPFNNHQQQQSELKPQEVQHLQSANTSQYEQSINETSVYQPTHEVINETVSNISQYSISDPSPVVNKIPCLPQQTHGLSSRGSMSALNGSHYQAWSGSNNNNNSSNNHNNNNNLNILPKGGKSRNANILSAVLCLVKELDYISCEVVLTAIHCRMEETSQ